MDAEKGDKPIELIAPPALETRGQSMKRAFADDPLMSELHAIREKHYQQTKATPATDRNRLASFLSSYGYRVVPTKWGTRKLVRSLE
jgi:hypothetical protein